MLVAISDKHCSDSKVNVVNGSVHKEMTVPLCFKSNSLFKWKLATKQTESKKRGAHNLLHCILPLDYTEYGL